MINQKELRANMLLLTTAIIWGFSFVFIKMGASHLGAFSFNGLKFVLASLALIPLIYAFGGGPAKGVKKILPNAAELRGGVCAGAALFLGAVLQQAGISSTTAGKAAFITGLYLVVVPIYSLFLRRKVYFTIWIAAFLAVAGMYFLCIDEELTLQRGDVFVFIGIFFWAAHIILVDLFNAKVDPFRFSWVQLATAACLSMAAGLIFEQNTLSVPNIRAALIPLLYAGICSTGIGNILQVLGQKDAKPAPATLIMSMESVFAVIAGYLVLGENLLYRELFGCGLMIVGMLLAQYKGPAKA